MTNEQELEAIAKAIIDSLQYMTLGTADESGLPWVSPVWYAPADYSEFFWVSRPEATHSRNVALRPQVSIAIFDSRVPVGEGQAVYMSAVAGELTGDDLERGIGIFSGKSEAEGVRTWTLDDVLSPARHRLYCATATEHYVLTEGDRRSPVNLG